jgi:LysR family transcriptional regulator, hydrogen peroxide-inducible genes activator
MPVNSVKHPGVLGIPLIEPEFWREVNLVSVRGRPYTPPVGALVREAMRVKWFGNTALAVDRLGKASPPQAANAPAAVS